MKKSWIRGFLSLGLLSGALFISGQAHAGVGNPDYYYVAASDMEIYNNANSTWEIGDSGTIEGDLASDASFA